MDGPRLDGPRIDSPRMEGPRAEPPLMAAERETDLDAVHGMIRRLADEVNVGDEPTLDGLPPQKQESVLRASLNALQTTANVMRSSKKKDGLPPVSTGKANGPAPPPITPSHAKLAALADAVAAGRIDAALMPIVGLADQQVHYYEVVARPRDERGNLLATTTRDPQLAIAGLLPLLDSARLRQAAQVAGALAEDGRETCLFTPATAVSLANDGFLDELADAYRAREALANDLVMTFAQADVRTFGSSEWSALTDMRDLGFRFGVEDVTDFDYEFTALCAAGFAFVKLDAATLLGGLAGAGGPMSAEEVCRNLGELGLTLIVTNIGDEATRDGVLAAGVPLGQGPLFGPPAEMGAHAFAAQGIAAA
jgi:EAL domain-containing protein (putative c-di-GMP-specific phosphodiesterase class I)